MSGLYGSLSIALSALITNQQALETSANNVANVNTPGFSRQRPVLVANDPVVLGRLSFGTGVTLQKFESLRDPILELRLNQETQNQGELDATPLAAEFRLVSGTARDYFSVVAGKRKLADLKTLYEVAQQTEPHLHQFAGFAWNRVHIKPGRRPGG
jgi:hypothetical protein